MKIQIPPQLQDFAAKQMTRKQFLRHTAAMALFVAGGGMIAQSLIKGASKVTQQQPSQNKTAAANLGYGYGASVYGGVKARAK